jgi:hypothetical protein
LAYVVICGSYRVDDVVVPNDLAHAAEERDGLSAGVLKAKGEAAGLS